MINIALTIDDNYCQHAAALIASICCNNLKEKLNFFILSDYISDKNIDDLKQLCLKYDSSIEYFVVDKNSFKLFPIGKGTINTYISHAAYYRLFIPEILPTSVCKVLYLDCDIIVKQSLSDLWDIDVTNYSIAGCHDQDAIVNKAIKRLKYSNSYPYINSGVMLMNLDYLRKINFTQKSILFINNNISMIKYHDQDVINKLLHETTSLIPMKWNMLDCFFFKKTIVPEVYRKEYCMSIEKPAIIHFAGPLKPWYLESMHPYKYLYYNYLKETPWRGYEPVLKYSGFKNRGIYILKVFIRKVLSIF